MTAEPDQAGGGSRAYRLLLETLVCPLTKTRLEYDRERQELISHAAGLAYPIRDGVPLMTGDAARPIGPEE